MSRELQFSVAYMPVEDRLLMRAVFQDGVEIQLWLTRRFTGGFLDLAGRVARDMVKGDRDDLARSQVADFARQAAADQADYGQAMKPGELHPAMASGPRVVTGAKLDVADGRRIAVALQLDKGEAITINLLADNLWSLINLIAQYAARAEWGLAMPTAAAGQRRPTRVN